MHEYLKLFGTKNQQEIDRFLIYERDLIIPVYAFAESSRDSGPLWDCGTKPIVRTKEQIEIQKLKYSETAEKTNKSRSARIYKSKRNNSENTELLHQNCKSDNCVNENESIDLNINSKPIDSTY